MTGYRTSAHLRELHDAMRCPSECPICARIDAAQDRETRSANDFLTSADYEEN